MKNFNILIVEDEALVALEIKQNIEKMGFTVVDYATNAKMVRTLLTKEKIDLILMDINLHEEIDGIDLYKSLKIQTPIIYITAYKDDATIAKAIATNPCGYILKPYQVEELKAMLELVYFKVLQRNTSLPNLIPSHNIYHLNHNYHFDFETNRLYYHTVPIHLTPKENHLLRLLIEHHGNPLSFEEIQHIIWKDEPISDNAIRTLIYRLRGKLDAKLIQKVFGYGIQLVSTP
jgi:DNA-binding response OmpR family regulator